MKHVITFAFLGAAMLLYAIGWGATSFIAIAFGVVAEIIFWLRLFRRRTPSDLATTS
jgi:hypothetical protein